MKSNICFLFYFLLSIFFTWVNSADRRWINAFKMMKTLKMNYKLVIWWLCKPNHSIRWYLSYKQSRQSQFDSHILTFYCRRKWWIWLDSWSPLRSSSVFHNLDVNTPRYHRTSNSLIEVCCKLLQTKQERLMSDATNERNSSVHTNLQNRSMRTKMLSIFA